MGGLDGRDGIVHLNNKDELTRGSVVMEGALGHPWEDLHHWIRSVGIVHVHEVDHFRSICHKDSAKEEVYEIDLADDIDHIEQIAKEIPEKLLLEITSRETR